MKELHMEQQDRLVEEAGYRFAAEQIMQARQVLLTLRRPEWDVISEAISYLDEALVVLPDVNKPK